MGRILHTLVQSLPRVTFVCVGCGTPLGEEHPERMFTYKDIGPAEIIYSDCPVCRSKRLYTTGIPSKFQYSLPFDGSYLPDH